jgi:hypothetical protein
MSIATPKWLDCFLLALGANFAAVTAVRMEGYPWTAIEFLEGLKSGSSWRLFVLPAWGFLMLMAYAAHRRGSALWIYAACAAVTLWILCPRISVMF